MEPPWEYTSFGTAKLPYETMSDEQLKNFPFNELMDKRCIVFCWITSPLALRQYNIINYWCEKHKLTFQGEPYLWVKTKNDGTPLGATGPRPRLVKPVSERITAFSNVKKGRPLPLLLENEKQCVMAPDDSYLMSTDETYSQRYAHSVKPDVFRQKISNLFAGDLNKIELFARNKSEGWDVWGNEAS